MSSRNQGIQTDGAGLRIEGPTVWLFGTWTVTHLATLEQALLRQTWPTGQVLTFDTHSIGAMDTAGAWLLHGTMGRLREGGCQVTLQGATDDVQSLLALVAGHPGSPPRAHRRRSLLEHLGRNAVAHIEQFLGFLAFVGETVVNARPLMLKPLRIRWPVVARELGDAGYSALPIVGLLSFLLGVVIAYQGGEELRSYGAGIYVADLVGLSMLRELAPMMTAIIVAGRTGSAYTAQIGTMTITEEIAALRTLGISPTELLVLPKMIALVVAVPLLTVYADAVGVAGGMIMAKSMLDVNLSGFLNRLHEAIGLSSFLAGIGKAPVFAMIVATVGCYQGFRVEGSAESVGRQTTISVVQAIFLVIVADSAFSIMFSWLGI